MTFDKKLNQIYRLVLEQDTPAVPPADPASMTAGAGPITPDATPADAATPEVGTNDNSALTPQGEVMLIRLIAKALTIKPSPEDLIEVVGLKDINETNAKQTLTKLISIIRGYADVSTI